MPIQHRDMSGWPKELIETLTPGVAPTLDRLAEEAHQLFWSEAIYVEATWTDTGKEILNAQDLEAAAIRVIEKTSVEDQHRALIELWGLSEYALPYPTSYDTLLGNMLCGAAVPKDIMEDLLLGAIAVRCRLDEATETEDRIRWQMRRLGHDQSTPEVEALTAALAGRTSYNPDGPEPSWMPLSELAASMQEPGGE